MQQIVFLDTEMTGLDYNDNQILQISYIICKPKGEITKEKTKWKPLKLPLYLWSRQ